MIVVNLLGIIQIISHIFAVIYLWPEHLWVSILIIVIDGLALLAKTLRNSQW